MIRILHCVNNMHRAGLETMLMTYYRNIDRNKVQFDFLMHRRERSDYDDEIESLGGKIYRAPRLYPHNYPAYFAYMKKFFQAHPEYKIMHSHIDAMSYLPLLAGKKSGVPVRIAHSHNTSINLDIKYPLKTCFRFLLPTVANYFLACGEEAGQYLFNGATYQVIPNAIDCTKFSYHPEVRESKRRELNLGSEFVLGHVGRFCREKNHSFIIDIFDHIHKIDEKALLLLVGTGATEAQIKSKVAKLGLSESVRFLGKRDDVGELYQAMDLFVMPSLFEGVPIVGIEAQFSGLPCLFSERIPKEVAFSKTSEFLSLGIEADQWAKKILHYRNKGRVGCECTNTLFDIKYSQEKLTSLYGELFSRVNQN